MIDYSSHFIKLPREVLRLLTSGRRLRSGDFATLAVFVVMLARAAWTRREARGSHGVVMLEVGQLVFGRCELADELGAKPSAIRTAVETLERHRLITIESTKRGSIATIVGYSESYDSRRPDSPSPAPSVSPTNHQRITNGTAQPLAINGEGSEISCENEIETGRERPRKPPHAEAYPHSFASASDQKDPVFPLDGRFYAVEGWAPCRSAENVAAEREALRYGIDLDTEFEKLVCWAQAHGKVQPDWDGMWRNWLDRSITGERDTWNDRRAARADDDDDELQHAS